MFLNCSNNSSSGSVLVIDDELSIRTLLELMLTRKGLKVDTAISGEEGIEKFDASEYRLVMTDMKMPGISGNQVLDYIKDHKKSDVPVVGMSATPWLMNQEKFDAILPKPSSIENIWSVVKEAVQKSSNLQKASIEV